MATTAENVIAAGKENEEMLIDSIKNGPVKLLLKITVKDTDGFTDVRRPQKVADLSQEEKLRYNSDIRAVNIILLCNTPKISIGYTCGYLLKRRKVLVVQAIRGPPFEEEILTFLKDLGHSGEIKDQSIPRRNRVNWHFAMDDPMFTTIKVVSRHEDTQLYSAILPDEWTNKAIKDSEYYKEYYVIAS
ncbi:hypothetical protein Tco_1437153 [Tanacetum coccineum]